MQQQAWALEFDDGGRLTGTRFGGGKRSVLLLHGQHFDQASWHDVAYELAEAGLAALTLDFRGYGLSSALPEGASHDRDVVRVMEALRAEGADEVCLLGGSMGAAAALRAAALHGARVDRIAALSPALDAAEVAQRLPAVPILLLASRDEPYVDLAAFGELCPHPLMMHLYPGDAHNQALLRGPHGPDVRRRLQSFLTADLHAGLQESQG